MKILLSAYACAPNIGSEQGVGWNFAKQLSLKDDYQLTVITNDASKISIETEKESLTNVTFIYFDFPRFVRKLLYRNEGFLEHIYFFFWQVALFFYIRKHGDYKNFDFIHQVTLGVFRTPVFLGLLGRPLVIGPLGGGDTSTAQLQKKLPLSYRFKEKLREAINRLTLLNPLSSIGYNAADLILLSTSANLNYIPKRYHHKCQVSLGVGIPLEMIVQNIQPATHRKEFKILYAGRLLYWKGIHLAIQAYANLLSYVPHASFTIVGAGTDEDWLKKVASTNHVANKIDWIQKLPQNELLKIYRQYDVFLYPSMHDAMPTVVIEALAGGLPVICLDLGGPKEMVDHTCGIIIKTNERTEEEIVTDIAAALYTLSNDPLTLQRMKASALHRASYFSWQQVVERNYAIIIDRLKINE